MGVLVRRTQQCASRGPERGICPANQTDSKRGDRRLIRPAEKHKMHWRISLALITRSEEGPTNWVFFMVWEVICWVHTLELRMTEAKSLEGWVMSTNRCTVLPAIKKTIITRIITKVLVSHRCFRSFSNCPATDYTAPSSLPHPSPLRQERTCYRVQFHLFELKVSLFKMRIQLHCFVCSEVVLELFVRYTP